MSGGPRARRRAAAVALAACLGSCSAVTTMYATPGPRPAVHPLPVPGTPLFDWKGVVHCHSRLSHDSQGTLAEIAAACRTAQVDFVVMTDHQTDASIRDGVRGMVGDTLFVVGAEVRSRQGTIIAFPLVAPLRRWQQSGLLVKEAQDQGGIAFICHAELWRDSWDLPGLTGMEIVNLHAGVLAPNKLGTLLTGLLLPLRLLFERICVRDPEVFRQWDRQLDRRHPFTPVGGNDAHANVHLFGPLGGTMGNYQEVFLTLSTHVLAERLDEPALVDALRRGRSYVSFDIFGEGAGFDFRAVDGDGVHLPGSTVPASPSLQLSVHAPDAGIIELWRDGAIVRTQEGSAMTLTAPECGVYRVEVRRPFGTPWLFSSSIRVVPPP